LLPEADGGLARFLFLRIPLQRQSSTSLSLGKVLEVPTFFQWVRVQRDKGRLLTSLAPDLLPPYHSIHPVSYSRLFDFSPGPSHFILSHHVVLVLTVTWEYPTFPPPPNSPLFFPTFIRDKESESLRLCAGPRLFSHFGNPPPDSKFSRRLTICRFFFRPPLPSPRSYFPPPNAKPLHVSFVLFVPKVTLPQWLYVVSTATNTCHTNPAFFPPTPLVILFSGPYLSCYCTLLISD